MNTFGKKLQRIQAFISPRPALQDKTREATRELIDAIGDPVFITGHTGNTQDANTAARARFAMPDSDPAEKPLSALFPAPVAAALTEAIARAIQDNEKITLPLPPDDGHAQEAWIQPLRSVPFAQTALVILRRAEHKTPAPAPHGENLIYSIFTAGTTAMVICDPDTLAIIETNDRFVAEFGLSRQQAAATTLTTMFSPGADRIAPPQEWQAALLDTHHACEARYRKKNGELSLIELIGNRLDHAGRPALLVMLRDITAHKRTESVLLLREAQLREASQFSQQILSRASDGIVVFDTGMRQILWNEQMESLTGIAASRALGRTAAETFSATILATLESGHQASLDRVIVTLPDLALTPDDANPVWLSITFSPNYDGRGKILGSIATLHDMTGRRQAEQVLREHREKLAESLQFTRDVISSVSESICAIDRDFRYVMFNHSLEQLSGVPARKVLGRVVYDAFPGLREQAVYESFQSALAGATLTTPDQKLEFRDGRPPTWVSATYTPQRNTRAEIIGVIVTIRDVTSRKRTEQELGDYAARLARSNRELQEFAHIASHDLQEPLRKIRAFGDRLAGKYSDQLGPEGLDYLQRMRGAAERMQSLIENLLSYSRVVSRARPFETIALETIVRETLTDLELRIENTRAVIDIGDLPEIEADPTQMRQLFQNLLGNALKFTAPGQTPHIHILAETAGPETDPAAQWRITVQDNGIGFEEKYAERIFALFQRLHGRGEYEGTGIGLSICRRIVARHHGEITAASQSGEGATFVITLPARQPQSPSGTGAATAPTT
ncbi:MAG: PAS domain-containing protein [Blastocatellia bacterium]